MKRKLKLAPRNLLVVATIFRKSGVHVKANKALRCEQNMNTQREACRVERHLTFNQAKSGFESPVSHQIANDWRLKQRPALEAI